jgi:hypothetical protein
MGPALGVAGFGSDYDDDMIIPTQCSISLRGFFHLGHVIARNFAGF